MTRIMIDTNIFISAALFPNGKVSSALQKALVPPYRPVICDYVLDELHRKFREKWPDKPIYSLPETRIFLNLQ